MAKSDKDSESYEQDVFDNPPKGPAGVHRGNRSLFSRLAPFVVVVLVAALAGFAAWGVFSGEASQISWPWSSSSGTSNASGSSSDSSSDSSSSAAAKKAAAKKAKEAAAKKAAEEKAKEEEAAKQAAAEQAAAEQAQAEAQKQQEEAAAQAAAQPNKAATVRVINGTRTSGYAASKKTKLAAAGYTNVVAANPSGNLPSSTVVWYQSESDKATAEDIASTLGISNVQQASGISTAVVVVLMS